jgi:hypothetical protein
MSLKDLFELLISADLTNVIGFAAYIIFGGMFILGVGGLIWGVIAIILFINDSVKKRKKLSELARKREQYKNYH